MKNITLTSLAIAFSIISHGQTITLTFTGQDAVTGTSLSLDSVYIQNVTRNCDTVIFGENPSITLTSSLGINDPGQPGSESLIVNAPFPNPFNKLTHVQIFLEQRGELKLSLIDSRGISISEYEHNFPKGLHGFEISSAQRGLIFLVVSDGSSKKCVKLISMGDGSGRNQIIYAGAEDKLLKTTYAEGGFKFLFGDQLLYIAFKTSYAAAEITDSPTQSTNYTFQLISELPLVITSGFNYIGINDATCNCIVIAEGLSPVTARGICWSTSPYPTISDSHTMDGSGQGAFISHLTGLTPLTNYYARAYATNNAGTAYGDQLLAMTNAPEDLLAKLAGIDNEGKVWKLIRVVTSGRYPIEVGPYDHSTIWWAMGYNNNELAFRACMLDDQWTFYRDGRMEYEAGDSYWAEGGGIFIVENSCELYSDGMATISGENVSAWGSGSHLFELQDGADQALSAIGNGAFIGYYKVGNDYEIYDLTPMVQSRIDYKLIKLSDAEDGTDTLVVEMDYYDKPGDVYYLGYWRHVLVHYDDPADEPPIPAPNPVASFNYATEGFTVTFINNSNYADSYLWDFGDGATSTEVNPVHTYATEGQYMVTLTAYNPNGQNSISQYILLSTAILTEDILVSGPWKLQVTDHACYVGPGLGSDGWWITPLANLDGTMIGTTDDWSCMTDDEFIFSAGGSYEYKTNGGSRNDGYMGAPNGCWTDAEIAASPGAPFGSCNTHTFEFTPAIGASRAIITLTNGPGFAAFIGFMKGYYGGENANGANPPNGGNVTNRYEVIAYINEGTREVLIVSVDITYDHSGTAAWTMELER